MNAEAIEFLETLVTREDYMTAIELIQKHNSGNIHRMADIVAAVFETFNDEEATEIRNMTR